MSQEKYITILAVSEGWEDAYIKDKHKDKIYYVRAPYFRKQGPIDETVLRSSLSLRLIVPEIEDFPSIDVALEYIKDQYESQEGKPEESLSTISFSESVDVILDYAKEIKHPLTERVVENFDKREKLVDLLSELKYIRQKEESILAVYAHR